MAMVPPVYRILSGDVAVTALVADRISGQGYGGETPVAPYITWNVVSGMPQNYLADRPGVDDFRAQVDIWAQDAATAKQVAEAARDALEPHAYCVGVVADEYDPETQLYRYGFDWRFWESR